MDKREVSLLVVSRTEDDNLLPNMKYDRKSITIVNAVIIECLG